MNAKEADDAPMDGITVWHGTRLANGWWGKATRLLRRKRKVDVEIEGSFLFDFAVYVAPLQQSDPSEALLRGQKADTWLLLCDGKGYGATARNGPSMQALFFAANPTDNYYLMEAFKEKAHAVCVLGRSLITHKLTSCYCPYAKLASYKDESSPEDNVFYAEYTITLEDDAHLSEGIASTGRRGHNVRAPVRWLRWLTPITTLVGIVLGIVFEEPWLGGGCGVALSSVLYWVTRTKAETGSVEEQGGELPF